MSNCDARSAVSLWPQPTTLISNALARWAQGTVQCARIGRIEGHHRGEGLEDGIAPPQVKLRANNVEPAFR